MEHERLAGKPFVLIETNEEGALRVIDIGAHIAEKYGDKTLGALYEFASRRRIAFAKAKKAIIKRLGRKPVMGSDEWASSEEHRVLQEVPALGLSGTHIKRAGPLDMKLSEWVKGWHGGCLGKYDREVIKALVATTGDETAALLLSS
ncbi:MAG TPA: hypothetical protein VIJ88_03370 [Candidatus Paceibacterota bacterium]